MYRNNSICALVGQGQLTRALFILCTTCHLNRAWDRPRQWAVRRCKIMKTVDNLVKNGNIMKNCAGLWVVLCRVETQFYLFEVLKEDVIRCQKQVDSCSPSAANGLLEAHAIVPMDNTDYCVAMKRADVSPTVWGVGNCPCRWHPESVGGRCTWNKLQQWPPLQMYKIV